MLPFLRRPATTSGYRERVLLFIVCLCLVGETESVGFVGEICRSGLEACKCSMPVLKLNRDGLWNGHHVES